MKTRYLSLEKPWLQIPNDGFVPSFRFGFLNFDMNGGSINGGGVQGDSLGVCGFLEGAC